MIRREWAALIDNNTKMEVVFQLTNKPFRKIKRDKDNH